MADNFTMTPSVSDPVRTVEEMVLSIERVTALLGNSNGDYMEYVVSQLQDRPSVHRVAFNVWCLNQIAFEKLGEIHKVLVAAENQLMAIRAKAEGHA